jgi:hypothetical protein
MAKHFYDTCAAVKHYHAVISLRSDHTASYEIRNRAVRVASDVRRPFRVPSRLL